jgi:cell division protein FtsI/penicillin-binding protein 2
MARLPLDGPGKTLSKAERSFNRALRQKAIYPMDDQQRIYPSTNLAAHILGFVQERERETNHTVFNEMSGQDGIEAWFNSKLCGIRGWRVTEADNQRQEIVVYREQEVEPHHGLNVVLTIDMVLQQIVESELASAMKTLMPISASAIVVRPRTGEILAMATLPNYDPNQPNKAQLDQLRNRIISDIVEPGSTFKIVVVSAALNEKLLGLNDMFDCEHGLWHFMGRPLRDDHGGYGTLSVENIVAKSSNIGAAKIAIYKLGEQKLYDYIKAFGFGSRTGITLGGEVNGLVHKFKDDKLMISRVPMGQAVGVTHLQMAMAMAAIANRGQLMWPMLVSRLQDSTGAVFARYQPRVVRSIIDEPVARQMTKALKSVVSRDGTAAKAAMEGYTVAGKTGTAQKVIDRNYAAGKYTTSFIGFFPADEPELCISVMLDEPRNGHYGGQIAAPIFKAIAEQAAGYLKIPPEREEPPPDTSSARNALERLSALALPSSLPADRN